MSTSDITVGRILPKFVTPSDVRDLKVRVDAFVRATDQTVAGCAKVPNGVHAGWTEFSNAWRSYFDEEDSWWHTAAQMDQGEAYERDLGAWQTTLASSRAESSSSPAAIRSETTTASAVRRTTSLCRRRRRRRGAFVSAKI